MPKPPPYEPVRPVSTDRAGNARRYMGNMAKAANSGLLASETLVGLQRPSQGLPEGVPAMVLRRDSAGVWYAAEWSEPDVTVTERNATVTPDRNAEAETVTAVTPTVTERNALERGEWTDREAPDIEFPTRTNAERQKAYRDRERAKERGETG